MPDRLDDMFERVRGKRPALITYATGFYPDRRGSAIAVRGMLDAGADAVEIGIPFSDPVLDGPVIQASSASALKAGATVGGVLELLGEARRDTESPLLLMTYYNPLLAYGLEPFARDAVAAGADAVIIPDLPIEEMQPWKRQCDEAGLGTVAFCSLTTSDTRIAAAGSMSSGFLYCVSLMGTTGPREVLSPALAPFLGRVRANTSCPLGVGLGISTPEQCAQVGQLADAVIVGSALVRLVGRDWVWPDALGAAVATLARSLAHLGLKAV